LSRSTEEPTGRIQSNNSRNTRPLRCQRRPSPEIDRPPNGRVATPPVGWLGGKSKGTGRTSCVDSMAWRIATESNKSRRQCRAGPKRSPFRHSGPRTGTRARRLLPFAFSRNLVGALDAGVVGARSVPVGVPAAYLRKASGRRPTARRGGKGGANRGAKRRRPGPRHERGPFPGCVRSASDYAVFVAWRRRTHRYASAPWRPKIKERGRRSWRSPNRPESRVDGEAMLAPSGRRAGDRCEIPRSAILGNVPGPSSLIGCSGDRN
jgi:hypothetical protein